MTITKEFENKKLNIYVDEKTPIGQEKMLILKQSNDGQISKASAVSFGEIYFIGANHKEAKAYFEENAFDGMSKAAEIKLHHEIARRFRVVLYNDQ